MRVFVAYLMLATVAVAAPKKPVVALSGDKAMAKTVSKGLSGRYTLKPVKVPATRAIGPERVVEVTKPLKAIALINVIKKGKNVSLVVFNAADGSTIDSVEVVGAGRKAPRTLPKPTLAALTFALGNAQVWTPPAAESRPAEPPAEVASKEPERPAEKPVEKAKEPEPKQEPKSVARTETKPEPTVESAPEPEPEAEPESQPSPSPHYAFRASVGGGIFNRNLSWINAQSTALGNSPHPASGVLSIDLSTYPGAAFTSNALAHIGAFVSADIGANMRSRYGDTESLFLHEGMRARTGLLGRLPLADTFSLFAHAGWQWHKLSTTRTTTDGLIGRPAVPDVAFDGPRFGLGLRWQIVGPLELEVTGGFQVLTRLGEFHDAGFWPDARGLSADAGGALSVEVVPNLRLRAGFEWQRYFLSLNPGADAQYVVSNAGDQYLWATGGLQWSM